MSNATSTPVDDTAPRRSFPLRAILAVLLLALAVGYMMWALPPFWNSRRAALRAGDLEPAGMAIEGVESMLADGVRADDAGYADFLSPLFSSPTNVAYVRVWDDRLQPLFTMMRQPAPTLMAGDQLTSLHVQWMLEREKLRAEEKPFAEGVDQFLSLMETQDEVSMALQRQHEAGKADKAASNGIFSLQCTNIDQSGYLLPHYPALREAREAMQVTCDDLQLDPPAVADAQDSSEDAEYALSQGLEALRGSQEGTLALPAEMARLAPAPETWGGYIWPRVRGRRLFIPLFKPANVETMVAPSGYAEIVFFQRSGDTLAAPGWRWLIPLGLLAAAVGVLLRRRRRAAENGSVVMESIVQGVDEKEKEE